MFSRLPEGVFAPQSVSLSIHANHRAFSGFNAASRGLSRSHKFPITSTRLQKATTSFDSFLQKSAHTCTLFRPLQPGSQGSNLRILTLPHVFARFQVCPRESTRFHEFPRVLLRINHVPRASARSHCFNRFPRVSMLLRSLSHLLPVSLRFNEFPWFPQNHSRASVLSTSLL